MRQVYKPYWLWEDFNNGMWRKLDKDQEEIYLKKAIEFTGDHVKYGEAMGEVIMLWKNTMLNSLTNPSINKRAFLGHCACQYKINCPEYIVRMAWAKLTEQQRIDADKIAQYHINEWIKNYETENKQIY